MPTQHPNMIHNQEHKKERVLYYSAALPLFVPWSWHGWLVKDVLLDNEMDNCLELNEE